MWKQYTCNVGRFNLRKLFKNLLSTILKIYALVQNLPVLDLKLFYIYKKMKREFNVSVISSEALHGKMAMSD